MIYTSGQELLDRQQLHQIPVTERENKPKYWQGIRHGDLADTLVHYVNGLGFNIVKETWYCNPTKTALYGAIDIDASGSQYELNIGQAAHYSIGVRHDNAGRYAVSLAMGARVVVCSNGLFTGDFVLKNRHYESLDLEDAVATGIERWMERCEEVGRFAKLLQGVEIDNKDAAYLITHAAMKSSEDECFPWASAKYVLENWHKPPHEEFAPRTLWSCYNAFTEVSKTLSPPKQLRLMKGLLPMMQTFAHDASLN